MFKLNLKIALRSIWKNKVYAFICIAGLTVALAVFILAMLYASYEKRYDTWNAGYEQIYRVNYSAPDENVALSTGNMATLSKQQIPAVEAATRIQDYWWGDLLVKTKNKSLYLKDILMVDSTFFEVFNYPAVYGNLSKALKSPQSIIISRETSELIFGKDINPVGETLKLDNKEGFVVDAVIDAANHPAHFKFNMLKRFRKNVSDEYYSNNYYTYVKLNAHADLKQTEHRFNSMRKQILNAEMAKLSPEDRNQFSEYINKIRLYLQPVKDIHLSSKVVEYEFLGNGTSTYMYMMIGVAALVLIIAAVNFANLSLTMATGRAKETGVRKVLGAQKMQIGMQFILETALQCIVSLLLALVLVELMLPSFNNMISRSIPLLQWSDYKPVILPIFGVLIMLTCLVGLYPALMISNIIPSKVLKGNFGSSNAGSWLRNLLIVLQFSIAALFISGIWIINSQLNYMQAKDLGYKPEQVFAVQMLQDDSDQHYNKIKNTLQDIPGVNSISRTDHIPGEDMGGNSYVNNGTSISANFITVDAGYVKTMGLELLEGREYISENVDSLGTLMLTETAARIFGLKDPVGKTLRMSGADCRIVGLVKDFNHYSPEKSFQPIVFHFQKGNPMRYVIININPSNSNTAIKQIEQAWQKLEPEFPIKATFLDKTFHDLLQGQRQLKSVIALLSVVTIVLALMGLFAIAAFNTQRRSKEISVRKILGASLFDILKLLNKGFVKLILLGNLVAWPIAYLLLQEWLTGFAFRVELTVLPFLLAGLTTLLLTILVVSLQSFRTANANPVDALKYE